MVNKEAKYKGKGGQLAINQSWESNRAEGAQTVFKHTHPPTNTDTHTDTALNRRGGAERVVGK